jgi:hypothetical protein
MVVYTFLRRNYPEMNDIDNVSTTRVTLRYQVLKVGINHLLCCLETILMSLWPLTPAVVRSSVRRRLIYSFQL